MKKHDVVIIGGGHNGLVCAAYLARAGRRVLVLERRERVGGAAMSEEVFPGFRFSVFSYVVSLLRPEIIRDLELPRHGLHILPLESTLTPLPPGSVKGGNYLAQWNDHDRNRRELARHSPRDAEATTSSASSCTRWRASSSRSSASRRRTRLRCIRASSSTSRASAATSASSRRSSSTACGAS
jgi:phytoene dehydrogenase-like protein